MHVVCCLHYYFLLSRITMLLYISVYHSWIHKTRTRHRTPAFLESWAEAGWQLSAMKDIFNIISWRNVWCNNWIFPTILYFQNGGESHMGIVAPIWVHWNRSLNVVSCNPLLRHRWVGGIWEPGFTLQTEPELWMIYCSNCYFQSAVYMFHTDLCSGSLTFWMQSKTGKLNIKSLCILDTVTGRAFKPWT